MDKWLRALTINIDKKVLFTKMQRSMSHQLVMIVFILSFNVLVVKSADSLNIEISKVCLQKCNEACHISTIFFTLVFSGLVVNIEKGKFHLWAVSMKCRPESSMGHYETPFQIVDIIWKIAQMYTTTYVSCSHIHLNQSLNNFQPYTV